MTFIYKKFLKLLTRAFFWKMLVMSRTFLQNKFLIFKDHNIKTADQNFPRH